MCSPFRDTAPRTAEAGHRSEGSPDEHSGPVCLCAGTITKSAVPAGKAQGQSHTQQQHTHRRSGLALTSCLALGRLRHRTRAAVITTTPATMAMLQMQRRKMTARREDSILVVLLTPRHIQGQEALPNYTYLRRPKRRSAIA